MPSEKGNHYLDEVLLCSANEQVRARWLEALDDGLRSLACGSFAALRTWLGERENLLVLLHMQLPDLGGAEGIVRLREAHPGLPVLVFADHPNNQEGLYLLKHGVNGYFNTYLSPPLLRRAMGLAGSGQVLVSSELMKALLDQLQTYAPERMDESIQRMLARLTDREYEIVKKICEGKSNKRIAISLNISERTVKAHLSSIFRKTGIPDRLQLAMRFNGQCV
ncbi:MAG: response regulator transcription factor [Gammaproteobacteria bacterium]|jgi:two-component system nitrate/nitrite response regulator NarL